MSKPSRRPRADAARNRELVLAAARELIAERGDAVQMADVARRAGVGVGTVYRHFPNRNALISATAGHRFERILAHATTTCLPEPDARAALRCLLTHIGEVHQQERSLSVAIEAVVGDTEPRGEIAQRLWDIGAQLLARGKDQQVIRDDAEVPDLYMIVGALSAVSRHSVGDWRRFIDLALDGLAPRSR